MSLPKKVNIVEVGARDGLQNEKAILPTATKVALIEGLANCQLTHIEATSFVSPKWVPQMADAADVIAQLERKAGVIYSALTPNERGLDAAIEAGVNTVAVFAAAAEGFSAKNLNCSIAESMQRYQTVVQKALDNGLAVRGYVSTVVDCPYDGAVAPTAVAEVCDQLYQMGCYEISLGDTIGTGTPNRVKAMLEAVNKNVPIDKLAVHFHDTYGQALSNIHACLEEGVSTIDSSIAGLGGCPYAKGASGNVATEDVLYLLNGLGLETGVSLEKLIKLSNWICLQLARENGSKVARALS